MATEEINEIDNADESAEPSNFNDATSENADDDSAIVAEPRQPINRSTLVMIAIIAIGAGGLYFMSKKTGPATAGAAVNKETIAAKNTINKFLSGGDSSIKTMESLIRNTEKVVAQFVKYPSMTQVPLSDLHVNPFRQFTEKKDAPAPEMDEAAVREQQRQAALKAVQALALQSVMYSDARRACMINSVIYREGQTVDAFTIDRITPASVIVRSGVYRFELKTTAR